MLSFLDAFSSYHQINMYLPNAERDGLYNKKGTYCYQVTPFGLKNTRAMYKRMINRVFKDFLGEVMEDYVDNMIVKASKVKHTLNNWRKFLLCSGRIIYT